MLYSYKSNGIVSRSISDYRDNILSDFSNFRVWEGDNEFTEGQYQTVRISDVNYGTVGDYGSQGIGSRTKGTGVGSDTQVSTGGIHIVGEKGPTYISGSATCFAKFMPITGITCFGTGANRYCVYSYEAGNRSETVGQHGSSVINAGIGARRIDSFQFIFDTWQSISRFTGAAECRAYIYEPCITEDYNELDYGLVSANHTSTIDNGLITHSDAVTITDRGHILDGYRTRFGFKKVIGEAQARATNAWIGSGRIKKFGRQVSPAVWGAIADGKVRIFGAADVDFSASLGGGGFSRLHGFSITGFTVSHYGDGILRKFGGSAESATWNPDEKQMLFSFIGGASSEKHVLTYRGSGRIRNLAKVEAEKGTFVYNGSGSLNLRPRKPVDYQLSDLANFTLEGDTALGEHWQNPGYWHDGSWNQTTKLGHVQLKQLTEWSHEAHTEVYTHTAFVPYTEVDYGTLVNQANLNCVANSGTISTNTTATTGCTQVAPGTTLAIAPGSTYTIPTIQTTPSTTIDYGDVANPNAPQQIDHGWILGERSDVRTPYGLFRITSRTDVVVTRQFHFTSDGTPPIFKIWGDTTLPLDVAEEGTGNLFTMGGAAETTAVALDGTGLFRFLSLTTTTRARDFVGFGTLRKISGAAESLTWNPTEEQILFSIIGVGTEKHTEVYRGDGRLSTFSGAAESILWSAQHTTGLYRISGDSHDTRARAYVGSGSLKKFSGAVESLTFNPLERRMLFSFTGGITSEKHTEVYVGSGRIRNLATLKAEKGTFDYVGSGTLKLNPRKPQIYQLSDLGQFTLDFYSLRNAFLNLGYFHTYTDYTNLGAEQLKWLSLEQGHEKHTEVYNNSACEDGVELDYGTLVNTTSLVCTDISGNITTNTTAATGCTKVPPGTVLTLNTGVTYTVPLTNTVPSVTEDYGLVSEGNAPERRDYGWILGSLSKVCPFGAFEITGTAKTHYVENFVSTGYSVSGKAGLSLSGAGATFWTPPYFGKGLGRITGTVGESWTPWIPPGDGLLWSMGGAAETTAQVWEAGGLFRIGSEAFVLFSLLHIGSGTIRITGEGEESRGRVYTGSGSLKKFSGAAESTTWNPLERQMLFSFTGAGAERFTANPPEEGTEIRLRGTTHPELLTFAEQPFGRIPVSGVGGTDRTRVFVGSGSLRKFSGAAESITFNPDEKQMLFSFLGTGTERFTANPPEEGAEIRLRGEGVVRATISQVGDIRISIFGDATSKTTKPFIGSGSLKKFSGAAESITFNPLERQLLFSFLGTGDENRTLVEIGSGRLFTLSGAVSSTAATYESTGLFRIDGSGIEKHTEAWVGSGSLKKFSGAAESITWNPDERQMLFSFTGAGSESTVSIPPEGTGRIKIGAGASDFRFWPNWISRGGLRIRVQSTYRFAPVWIGSGTLKKFSGAAESITFNPDEKQMLFSFTGTGAESIVVNPPEEGTEIRLSGESRIRWVPNNVGSGNIFITGNADPTHYVPHITGSGGLWTWNGAAESQAIAITSLPSLFRVYGNSDISRSRPYIGSGSLRKLGGSAESISFNPDEKQMLFSFFGFSDTTRARTKVGQGTVKTLGESTVRFSPVYFGSGTTRVSGEATVTRSRHFVGFGSLRKLSGAAESLTFNPEERQMLFSFTGVGAESRTSKLLSQSGVLAVRGTSGDPLLTFAEQPRVEIDITGDSIDLRTHAYQGSGRISNVNNADPSFVRAPYIGSGQIGPLRGVAFVQVIVWQPPNTQVWII